MAAVYESVIYDLNDFGVNHTNFAIVSCDKDPGIELAVSFDNGKTFIVPELNKKIEIKSNGKIKVRLIFNNENSSEYRIPITGNFSMLSIGTSLYFENKKSGQIFNTTIGLDGKYSIELPPGKFSIWFHDNKKKKIVLSPDFNSNIPITKRDPLIKENIVEMFFRDISWAKYCIFDVFEDLNKMSRGNAELDINSNLIDKQTNKVCRWWAIGLS